MPERDNAFEMAASSVRFGAGVTREIGMDLADRGHRRVMVVTDRVVASLPPVATVLESLAANNVGVVLYDHVRVEPTDASLRDAIDVARHDSQRHLPGATSRRNDRCATPPGAS